ncbi:hypothetical protein SELMODRAFT_138147 [Selaginella moellendorffii]|uniref:DAGKc domain-containing protein n=1 Tax=Selaginella moellendorffii TaxID=88036 RepID=D8TEQ1_SELML|nr:sphingoid long-chain bases kinase 2, mitochondrial isoform X2 [Selaginella moellendorffii]EFJ04852.1 hypothetical protein SELMODRAFT_138147 [Selaginella moellendorffii]|eukprot:XP_002994065.1 sphingoid long-chain bases kinase 2, mitochondrial isoform X2 [Selaginella moellendorffii]
MALRASTAWADAPRGLQLDSKKRECVFVVNPKGANGRTGREWSNIFPKLSLELSKHYNVSQVRTSGPFHATEATRKAVEDGAAAVIAVGGDGTLHEVVNGFFHDNCASADESSHKTALGLIPLGTGSDFARTFGWSNDPYQAIHRIARGDHRRIDTGYVSVGGNRHHFINVGALHLSAQAGYHATKYKWLGNLSYVIGALQAFMHHKNRDLDIRINGEEWKRFSRVTSIAIGNGKYFGGGMKITPTADPYSGDLEVTILQHFQWYHFVIHLFKLYKGTFLELNNTWRFDKVKSIEIKEADNESGDDGVFVQADGEHLGFLPAEFGILPGSLDFLC